MTCNLKASDDNAITIEVFEGLGITYLLANALGILFRVNSKSIHIWKQNIS